VATRLQRHPTLGKDLIDIANGLCTKCEAQTEVPCAENPQARFCKERLAATSIVYLMTIVELFLFVLAGVTIYVLLAPAQRRLESILYKFFGSKARGSGPVIDITDYSKRDKNK